MVPLLHDLPQDTSTQVLHATFQQMMRQQVRAQLDQYSVTRGTGKGRHVDYWGGAGEGVRLALLTADC
jgi:hypothetical protein